uniref:Uncharacterized protein n=1 Tax=Triticum urartu TaxID=4572 RepID=A0A8R7K0B8_TRIUA
GEPGAGGRKQRGATDAGGRVPDGAVIVHCRPAKPHRRRTRTSPLTPRPSSLLDAPPRMSSSCLIRLPFPSNFILVSHVGLVGKRRCAADCSSQDWCW